MSLHIERLRWITESPLSAAQARTLGARFGQALRAALPADVQALSVGELAVQLPARALNDPSSLARVARHAAQRIAASLATGASSSFSAGGRMATGANWAPALAEATDAPRGAVAEAAPRPGGR